MNIFEQSPEYWAEALLGRKPSLIETESIRKKLRSRTTPLEFIHTLKQAAPDLDMETSVMAIFESIGFKGRVRLTPDDHKLIRDLKAKGLTQSEIADTMSTSQSTISRVLNGRVSSA